MLTINELKEIIENKIPTYINDPNGYNNSLNESCLYSLGFGGKRLRPVLMLSVYQMLGKDPVEILDYACALECIHTYSLIHDDLPCMDNDDYRRGKLTNHKVFGEDIAMLAGDALLTKAFEIMTYASMKCEHISYDTKLKTINLISSSAYQMVEGQIADIQWSDISDINDLMYVYKNKTGALFRSAIVSGALLAECGSKDLNSMNNLSESFGRAFQIADDIDDAGKDEGPNIVKLLGIEYAKNVLNKDINTCREILKQYPDNENLIEIINMIEHSIDG